MQWVKLTTYRLTNCKLVYQHLHILMTYLVFNMVSLLSTVYFAMLLAQLDQDNNYALA